MRHIHVVRHIHSIHTVADLYQILYPLYEANPDTRVSTADDKTVVVEIQSDEQGVKEVIITDRE